MSDIDNAVSDADAELWAVQMPSGEVYTVTVDQLDDAFQRGLIDENTLVMQAGMDDWMSLADVLGAGSAEGGDSVDAEAPAEAEAEPEADDAGWPSAEEEPHAETAPQDEYASDRVSAELGLAAPNEPDASSSESDELFNRLIAPSGASSEEEPTQREMALSRPGGTTLLNYPPPPSVPEAFSTVAPLVQAAASMGVATPPPAPLRAPPPAPEGVAFSAPAQAAPTLSRPVPPPSQAPTLSRPVPPPADVAPYSRPTPPPSQLPAYSRPVPPPADAAPYSRPVPPPSQAPTLSRPVPPPSQAAPFSRPVPPPAGSQFPTARGFAAPAQGAPASSRPSAVHAQSYPPPAIGGVYPPPVISAAPSEPPGFAGPKSTPPLAYDVGDLDIPPPKLRRGRGPILAVAASLALVGGALGLSRMDGSSLMLFPQSSAPVAAAAPKPYTPPPAKPAPKPEPAPEPVVAKPEPATPKAADASEAKLASDMKKALAGAKIKPTKTPAKASMRPSMRKSSKASSSSSGALGKGGNVHDPLNGSL